MRLLIAGGGTGGHIYPALAVARSLREAEAPDGGPSSSAGSAAGVASRRRSCTGRHPAAPPRAAVAAQVDRSVHTFADPFRLAASVPQAAAILARERPAAIFTTGGYVAVPVLMAAAPLRIPVVLWDGNVIPGRAVRLTARLADVVAVSFEEPPARWPPRSATGRASSPVPRSAISSRSTLRPPASGSRSRPGSGSC